MIVAAHTLTSMVAMKGVEVFATGKWRGSPWKESHLDEMIKNFNENQAAGPKRRMRLALVKGHTAHELNDPSMPKHGTVTRIYREGGKLLYDADDVDEGLANDIKAGRFDDVSAEVYDNPPEGLPGKGKMLRRIAILGGDVPKIKGLNPLGLSRTLCYSERPMIHVTRYSSRKGTYEVFSESVPMGRDEMLAKLQELGMSLDVLNGLDDVQLAEIVKTGMGQGQATMQANPPADPNAPPPEESQPTGDQTVEKTEPHATEGKPPMAEKPAEEGKPLSPAPEGQGDNMPDDAEAAKKMYSEMSGKCKKFAEDFKKKFGGAAQLEDSPGAASTMPAQGFSEGQIEKALANVIAEGRAQIDRELSAGRNELKRQRIEMFCELERNTGRLEPADFDKSHGGTNIVDRLLALDDKALIHKFSEKDAAPTLTSLDAELQAIRARAVKYVPNKEKVESHTRKPVETFAEGSPAAHKAAFQSFAESKAERFRLTDTTPAEIISAWETATPENRRELEKDLGFPGV